MVFNKDVKVNFLIITKADNAIKNGTGKKMKILNFNRIEIHLTKCTLQIMNCEEDENYAGLWRGFDCCRILVDSNPNFRLLHHWGINIYMSIKFLFIVLIMIWMESVSINLLQNTFQGIGCFWNYTDFFWNYTKFSKLQNGLIFGQEKKSED